MDLPRVPLVAPSFFVPRSRTLESLFRGVCKNRKTGRRKPLGAWKTTKLDALPFFRLQKVLVQSIQWCQWASTSQIKISKSERLVRLTHLRTRDTLSPAFCASLWDWGTLRVLVFLCIINYVSHQFRDHCELSIQAGWVLNEKEKISCLWDLTLATTSADQMLAG